MLVGEPLRNQPSPSNLCVVSSNLNTNKPQHRSISPLPKWAREGIYHYLKRNQTRIYFLILFSSYIIFLNILLQNENRYMNFQIICSLKSRHRSNYFFFIRR